MIKILFIVPRFGSINRGVETYLSELINNINLDKFEISILSSNHDKMCKNVSLVKYQCLHREYFDWIFRIRLFRKIFSLFNIYGSSDFESLTLIIRSFNYLKNSQFDIILPFGGWWSFFISKKLTVSNRTKIIAVGHASAVKKEIILSDYFIALTPFSFKEGLSFIGEENIRLIPNGVDSSRFFPGRLNVKNTILCVAALTRDKNHILLLNALNKMPSDVRLILVGTGPLEKELKMHPACFSHEVIFKSTNQDQMPFIYREATVFTLASTYEAFGIVFLEALASGLNVVAFDAPRQRYVIGDPGFYCDVNDSDSYAESLSLAMKIEQSEKNILSAKRFSWDKIAVDYENFFCEVIENQ